MIFCVLKILSENIDPKTLPGNLVQYFWGGQNVWFPLTSLKYDLRWILDLI